MFFSNVLMLGSGLLMATTGVEARAIGKLSFLPHLPLSSSSSSTTLSTDQQPAQNTCAFSPHLPLRTTQSSFSIPGSAWPLLRTLLSEHILPQSTTTPSEPKSESSSPSQPEAPLIVRNSVATLPLRSFSKDDALESLVLGLVFSTGEAQSSDKELRRSLPAKVVGEEERRSCVEEAIRKVESERMMEGVLELDGRGSTVGFLIYRVD
ncbi:hypothetical protein VTL71DRAFT_11010 [Oculimacula yallundae]|uniref:Uncharacterized protein n=1 Tax=Oculimacula yallundae TaxID=86028 RepID=A0ABR4CXA4_9HELO